MFVVARWKWCLLFFHAQIFATACRFASAVFLHSCGSDRCFRTPFCFCSHTQWHVTVDVCLLLLLSDLRSLVLVSLSPLSRLIQNGTSTSACLSFCLPPPSLFLLSSLSFFGVSVWMWLLVVFPSSQRLCPTSRLLTFVATSFFAHHFSICSSTSDSMWHVLPTTWPLSDTYFEIQFNEIELWGTLCLVWMQHLIHPNL